MVILIGKLLENVLKLKHEIVKNEGMISKGEFL